MNTFDEIRNTEQELLEEKYLRKGAGVMFAGKSRAHGSKAEQHFKKANYYLESKPQESSSEANLEKLMLSIGELSKGLIEIRNQN
jgi:hypothetical protein